MAAVIASAVVNTAADRKRRANQQAYGAAFLATLQGSTATFSALEEALAGAGTDCASSESRARNVLRQEGAETLRRAQRLDTLSRQVPPKDRDQGVAQLGDAAARELRSSEQRKAHVLETIGYFRTSCPAHARRLREDLDGWRSRLERHLRPQVTPEGDQATAAPEPAPAPKKQKKKKRARPGPKRG